MHNAVFEVKCNLMKCRDCHGQFRCLSSTVICNFDYNSLLCDPFMFGFGSVWESHWHVWPTENLGAWETVFDSRKDWLSFLLFIYLFILILEIVLILCPFSEMNRKSAYASVFILRNMVDLPELKALCNRASIFIFAKKNSPSRSP